MSLSPLIIGHEGGVWWDSGVCWAPFAGAAAPNVKPPANAAPFLSSALRFSGFEPMRVSFADEANEERLRPRVYARVGVGGSPCLRHRFTPAVLMSRRHRGGSHMRIGSC